MEHSDRGADTGRWTCFHFDGHALHHWQAVHRKKELEEAELLAQFARKATEESLKTKLRFQECPRVRKSRLKSEIS
eukprot:4522344-Amphidinium_carterae.1